MSRLDALVADEYERNGEKKTTWIKIGVAFERRNGPGYTLRLKCLPVGKDGEASVLLVPPRPREARAGSASPGNFSDDAHTSSIPEDDMPF